MDASASADEYSADYYEYEDEGTTAGDATESVSEDPWAIINELDSALLSLAKPRGQH